MATIASLVLGADGSSTIRGTSEMITTPLDRQRFLARRRKCDAIVIGGNTARNERYEKTPVAVIVLSHARPSLLDRNPKAHWWALSPIEAVARAQEEFGENLSIEGGIALLSTLLEADLITQLELSVTSHTGGENKIDYVDLLAHFEKVTTEQLEGTIFYTCTLPIRKQK